MYNLHYVPTTLGVQRVEDKLYLGVREQKRLNTTGLSDWFWGCLFDYKTRGLKLGS
jgi:hypothetical protein